MGASLGVLRLWIMSVLSVSLFVDIKSLFWTYQKKKKKSCFGYIGIWITLYFLEVLSVTVFTSFVGDYEYDL